LAGTLDPTTGLDACPVSVNSRQGSNDPTQTGKTGMIVTCPRFEADGKTPSPLAGQAVVRQLNAGPMGRNCNAGSRPDRRGEEWLQTNTLDGQKGHDVFTRIEEPSYFQEYGPAGFHNAIGFANPKIINSRKAGVCAGTDPFLTGTNCSNTLKGKVTGERLSRTPDERLYSSGSHDAFYWTQCYVSFGDPDGEDFAFTKCDAQGNFTLTVFPMAIGELPPLTSGTINWWTPFHARQTRKRNKRFVPWAASSSSTCNIWRHPDDPVADNVYTRTFIDDIKDGLSQADEAGVPLINTPSGCAGRPDL